MVLDNETKRSEGNLSSDLWIIVMKSFRSVLMHRSLATVLNIVYNEMKRASRPGNLLLRIAN